MKAPFLLCDPALMMPPPADSEGAVHFWTRLIEWAADHRVRLGPAGHDLVLAMLGSFGWPLQNAENYPPGMAQLAHRTLATMLAQVIAAELGSKSPRLSPRYNGSQEGEAAIGADAAALHARGLVGLATAREHWEAVETEIHLEPPPPERLDLLFDPKQRTAGESDRAVAAYLKKRRVTIVGGIPSDRVIAELEERFAPDQVRWLGAERGSTVNLNPLEGLQSRVDVVYCVTGHIGHAGSTKAKKCCRKRGVELRKVANSNEIADDLCRRHGENRTDSER